jgi:hypothetical protein
LLVVFGVCIPARAAAVDEHQERESVSSMLASLFGGFGSAFPTATEKLKSVAEVYQGKAQGLSSCWIKMMRYWQTTSCLNGKDNSRNMMMASIDDMAVDQLTEEEPNGSKKSSESTDGQPASGYSRSLLNRWLLDKGAAPEDEPQDMYVMFFTDIITMPTFFSFLTTYLLFHSIHSVAISARLVFLCPLNRRRITPVTCL